MSSLTSNPIHDNQDAPSILKLLPSLPSPTTWELQNKTAIQLIDDANDYIHGFKHALRVHETERAIHLFLKACRISYILLPHHPECAQVQPKSAAFVLLSNLKQSIKETHELVKDIATPLQLIEEAGNIHPSSPNPQLIDNSITSPSPTRPTPVNVETSMDDSNIRLIPPKPTFTPATPIPSSVKVNANVQALFDEASALFGQLRPLSQNDLSSRAVNPKEDSTKLDTNWIVHRREISEPDIFAAVYEELDTKFNDQNRGNMFVNMETGGGRDVPLFAEKQLPGLPESSTNPALPLRDLEDWMDASYRTVEFDSSMYENQSMRTSSLDINLHLISPIDYDSMIKVDEPHTLSMSPQSPKVLTSLERSNNVDKQKDISNTKRVSFLAKKSSSIDTMSPIKIDKPYHTPKSPRKAETLASTSAPTKIVFRSTSSNDVKVTVSSNQHGTSLPKSPTPPAFLSKIGFGSNKDKQMQQDTTKRDLKNKPLVPTFQGVKAPTYIPLISFMPSQPTPHRNTSLKKKREHTSASKMATITSSPPNPKILGEQTADHLDPDDMLWQQNGIRMVLKADDKVQRGSQTVPQVYSESPPSQSDMHSSSPSGSSPATSVSPNISTVNPLITRLRVHARTNLGCIKYMTFSSIVSYSSDLFSKMRMYYEQKDYANAYTHGLQGMIIATNILPQHHDFRLEMGPPYYNYLNILEMIQLRYKDMLRDIQNEIEQGYHPRRASDVRSTV